MWKKKSSILEKMIAPTIALVGNLVLAYIVYFVARVAYLLENYAFFSEGLSFEHLLTLFGGGLVFDTSAILYTNMLYIVLMLFPLWLKERRWYQLLCKGVFVGVNVLMLIVNLIDAVYFPFTLRRTTTSVFREFDKENNLGNIFFTELVSHWYFVLLTIAVAWILWRLYIMPHTHFTTYRTLRQRLAFGGVMLGSLIVATPLVIGGCRGGLSSGIRPITINNANQYAKRPQECAVVLNTPFALLRTIGKNVFVVPNYYANPQALEAVFTPIHRGQISHPMRKKNVVILIVESFGKEYIGALNKDLRAGRYAGYTPHVDKLIAKSLVFPNTYANGHKSIDGMPSVLCGIPMFVEPFVLTPASMNSYTGMAGLLQQEGYATAFFHGANRGSMGFWAFANKTGFQHYYGRQDYAADARFGGDADFDTNWGIWDEPFMQYYCTKMGEMKQPFMTALFTVSSHHPFVVPEKYKSVYKEEELPIHKCIRYTDMAIGKFFEAAEKQPWFKNTIFVLTADHTNESNFDEYRSDIGTFSVPLIIYDPSGEVPAGVNESIGQQIDILPTIMGVLGYGKDYLSFGCNLLTTPTEQTYALNYINGVYQYVKYGHVLQFDGKQTKGVYALSDRTMKHNLVGRVKMQAQMERELKAIIQQYMERMVNDRLLPNK